MPTRDYPTRRQSLRLQAQPSQDDDEKLPSSKKTSTTKRSLMTKSASPPKTTASKKRKATTAKTPKASASKKTKKVPSRKAITTTPSPKAVRGSRSRTIPIPVNPDGTQDEPPMVVPSSVDAAKVNNRIPAAPQPVPSTPQKKATKKASSSKRKSPKKPKEPLVLDPPKGWKDIYSLVEELRADRTAPVDSDGSEALPQKDLGEKIYRYQILVALMLSSQTKDAVVGDAMRKLQEYGLTVDKISNETSPEVLDGLIRKVGFHNTKTKNILRVAEILRDEYDGDIPPTAEKMMELPGIGPKMAFIIENVAYGKQTGIGIDTHMHRIFNQLGWVTSKQPEQTRKQLEAWLPKEYWSSVNLLWVGFGQEVQQFQPKLLRKALDSTQAYKALKLVKKLGLDYRKVGKAEGCMAEINAVLKDKP